MVALDVPSAERSNNAMPSGSDNGSPRGNTGAKSVKAIKKASNSKKKKSSGAGGKGLPTKRHIPWMTVGAVAVVLVLIGVLAYNMVPKFQHQAEVDKYTPSESDKDPSTKIDGVVVKKYPAGLHVGPNQRVAYDQSPPFGGPHDQVWAACLGNIYPKPIRTENAVHSLEHGAIWIAYNPDKLDQNGVDELKSYVKSGQFMLMSPYPGLDKPISLQAWGHQLKLDSPDDKRIAEFIRALQQNKYTYPEVGAACSPTPGAFDPANPPPFDPTPPGPGAVPMDGKGLNQDQSELGGGAMPGLPGLPGGLPGAPGAPGAPAGQ